MVNREKLGIAKVKILKASRHIHVQKFLKYPPPWVPAVIKCKQKQDTVLCTCKSMTPCQPTLISHVRFLIATRQHTNITERSTSVIIILHSQQIRLQHFVLFFTTLEALTVTVSVFVSFLQTTSVVFLSRVFITEKSTTRAAFKNVKLETKDKLERCG